MRALFAPLGPPCAGAGLRRPSLQMGIELSGAEFLEVSFGNQVVPEIKAQVAPGEITVPGLLVTVVFCKMEQSTHIPGNQESQNRVLLQVYSFCREPVQVPPMAQGNATAEARHEVAVVVEMVVPFSQEGWLAGLVKEAGCRIGGIEPFNWRVARPMKNNSTLPVRLSLPASAR